MNTTPLNTFVIGGSGYVAGELLRLLAQHPHLHSPIAISESRPGESIAAAFPHLSPLVGEQCFHSLEDAKQRLATGSSLILSAAPHGVSAALLDELIRVAERAQQPLKVVDISADYRFKDAAQYANVYGHAHGAAHRLGDFVCGLPEHLTTSPNTAYVAHPGCFATAMLLSIWPLLRNSLTEDEFFLSGVTGSTGSGRKPSDGTHHPKRHSDLYAYNALAHRHSPEVAQLCQHLTGTLPTLHFVPHSGPFARGIHMTVQAKLRQDCDQRAVLNCFEEAYAHSAFVRVVKTPPRLKDVVGSNYAEIAVSTDGRSVAVTTVIDNLVKGAAGGAIQWANRLLGFAENAGLTAPSLGYT
jgi:N-acetyl-gamma-glutamyl-phosphate reductase common form